MSEILCPSCGAYNAIERTSCERCDIQLQKKAIIIHQDKRMNVTRNQFPSRQLKRIGASLAISAAAIFLELGFLYLRKRLNRSETGVKLFPKNRKKIEKRLAQNTEPKANSGKRVVSVYQEQVVEELSWGRPVRRIISRVAWRSDESIEV